MIGNKVDETIIAICDYIIKNVNDAPSDMNMAETTKALAELLSARASAFTDYSY